MKMKRYGYGKMMITAKNQEYHVNINRWFDIGPKKITYVKDVLIQWGERFENSHTCFSLKQAVEFIKIRESMKALEVLYENNLCR